MGALKIREYDEMDKDDIVDLLKRGLTEQFTLERWNWLHHNPITIGSDIVVAEYDGKIVGTVGAIKKRFRYNEETFIGGRHIDPVVDVSMRGKGVFFKMLNALNEISTDVNFSYTFPNNPSFKGFAKYGYKSIGPIYIQYCQLIFLKSGLKEKLRYLKTGVKLFGSDGSGVTKGGLDELENSTPVLPVNTYYLTRDLEYLKWRYADSPVKKYDILISRCSGQVTMACVVATEAQNISILDVIPYSKNIEPGAVMSKLKAMHGPVRIDCWDTGFQPMNRYFLGKGVQNFMILEGNLKMPDTLYDKNCWYVTKGEVEGN